jgi:small subunit ribosomal protein S11
MLIRQSLHRLPSSTPKCACCKTTRRYTSPPPIPPNPPEENAESESVPSTWPTRSQPPEPTPPSSKKDSSTSPLLDLIPLFTTKDATKRPKQSKDIGSFTPSTIKSFYPQEEGILLSARPNPSLDPRPHPLPPDPLQRLKHKYHFHINNSTRNTHITITDYNHNPLVVLSAGRLGLKHSKRATHEAGAATALKALKMFADKYPELREQGRIELILKGFGPGRQGALSTIFGPMGEEIRGRINRITDATSLAIGGGPASNRKRR